MNWQMHAFDLQQMKTLGLATGILAAAALACLVVHRILYAVVLGLAHRSGTPLSSILAQRVRGPFRLLLPLLAAMLVVSPLAFPVEVIEFLKHLFSLGIITAISWMFINSVLTGQDLVLSHFDVQVQDNLKAREIHTQITILVKILLVAIMIVTAGTMLMTFDKIRHVGVSILASAGMVGVILGFAAQRSIATVFAGLQIAMTQPIRIDDVVIVEGEWGWVEKITLTYVVIKIWDLRRLVVPVTYFLEKPFQNWTRVSASLLGTVFLYVDYAVPVDEVRQELQAILKGSDKWDGQVCGLQVTNCSERTMELRLLMSAADSGRAFDLRCEAREKMLAFLVKNHPGCLPKLRAEVQREEPIPGVPR